MKAVWTHAHGTQKLIRWDLEYEDVITFDEESGNRIQRAAFAGDGFADWRITSKDGHAQLDGWVYPLKHSGAEITQELRFVYRLPDDYSTQELEEAQTIVSNRLAKHLD